MVTLAPWSVTAVNLPDHADNKIHTDEGARAAGFDYALVAGTTVYAYMTHPAVEAWGDAWLSGGGGELRLRRPVFDNDPVDCVISTPAPADGSNPEGSNAVGAAAVGPTVTATVANDARATLELWPSVQAPALRDGDQLKDYETVLSEAEIDYGIRCGDDLTVYAEQQIAHPVTWTNLANSVFIDNLVTGPWIHVRSKIYHQAVAKIGAKVRIESYLLDRFDSRAGERALVDMCIFADDQPVATIEHEAIIVLP